MKLGFFFGDYCLLSLMILNLIWLVFWLGNSLYLFDWYYSEAALSTENILFAYLSSLVLSLGENWSVTCIKAL